jgi:hypothetical protein
MIFYFTECEDPFFVDGLPSTDSGERSDIREYMSEILHHISLGEQGFAPKVFAVGCGRCGTCEEERKSQKQFKWMVRLIEGIKLFREEGFTTWRSGKKYHFPKGNVFFTTLTVSNERYPGLTDDYSSTAPIADSALRELNLKPDFRAASYKTMKGWFQDLTTNSNINRDKVKYVVFAEWGQQATRRIHFHVLFFVPGDPGVGADFCRRFLGKWQEKTLTTQGDFRIIEDDVQAVVYATKYSTKLLTEHRTLSSQFGWKDIEYRGQLRRHGLKPDLVDDESVAGYYKQTVKGGAYKWRVLVEGAGVDVISEGVDLVHSLKRYRDGLSVLGDVVLNENSPTIYKGGYIKCEESQGSTLNKIFPKARSLGPGSSVRLVPLLTMQSQGHRSPSPQIVAPLVDTSRLSTLKQALVPTIQEALLELFPLSQYGLELQYRVFAATLNSSRRMSTPSTPPRPSS